MRENPLSLEGQPCPRCREGRLVAVRVDDAFDLRTETGIVHVVALGVPIEECPRCGEQLIGPESGRVRHDAICKTVGLLTPEEIRGIRERLGLTQSEFSDLTGFGEATISRWERGRLLQNRANDRYLRLLADAPDNVRRLMVMVEATPSPRIESPV